MITIIDSYYVHEASEIEVTENVDLAELVVSEIVAGKPRQVAHITLGPSQRHELIKALLAIPDVVAVVD
jgi:hypothetical protein